MNKTRTFLSLFLIGSLFSCLFFSCGDDSEDDIAPKAKRTVLIYMCAENSLNYPFFDEDSTEIVQGAANLPDDVNLILFADRSSKKTKPYIAKVDRKGIHILKSYKEDFYCIDKDKMSEIINWTFTKYPADSYAMTFWGHGNGWIITPEENDIKSKAKRKSYGYDTGKDNPDGGDGYNKSINIPDLAEVLSKAPHLDYIFFDCCQMMCAEVVYEFRNICDYIIGSPAEIPGEGAPYTYIVSDLFLPKENVGKAIVDDYTKYVDFWSYEVDGLPLSVVKTSNMDNLLAATKSAIDTVMVHYPYPNNLPVYDVIYYCKNINTLSNPVYYDLRNVMRKYLSENDFKTWDNTFQQTVIYSVHPKDIRETGKPDWHSQELSRSNFKNFLLNDDNYGGLSMFIPQTYYKSATPNQNVSIKLMQWNKGIDWTAFGWE